MFYFYTSVWCTIILFMEIFPYILWKCYHFPKKLLCKKEVLSLSLPLSHSLSHTHTPLSHTHTHTPLSHLTFLFDYPMKVFPFHSNGFSARTRQNVGDDHWLNFHNQILQQTGDFTFVFFIDLFSILFFNTRIKVSYLAWIKHMSRFQIVGNHQNKPTIIFITNRKVVGS